jgi:hypothetical protein
MRKVFTRVFDSSSYDLILYAFFAGGRKDLNLQAEAWLKSFPRRRKASFSAGKKVKVCLKLLSTVFERKRASDWVIESQPAHKQTTICEQKQASNEVIERLASRSKLQRRRKCSLFASKEVKACLKLLAIVFKRKQALSHKRPTSKQLFVSKSKRQIKS